MLALRMLNCCWPNMALEKRSSLLPLNQKKNGKKQTQLRFWLHHGKASALSCPSSRRVGSLGRPMTRGVPSEWRLRKSRKDLDATSARKWGILPATVRCVVCHRPLQGRLLLLPARIMAPEWCHWFQSRTSILCVQQCVTLARAPYQNMGFVSSVLQVLQCLTAA